MIRKILKKVYFFINERTYQGRLKYVYKRNHSKTLIVSFSGFSPTPVYNYMRTLNGVASDQLFILDDFGFKGSYYWYENGEDIPRRLTFDPDKAMSVSWLSLPDRGNPPSLRSALW